MNARGAGGAIVAAAALLVAGCSEDLGVDSIRYRCQTDSQCGSGWLCKATDPAQPELTVCVNATTWVEPDGFVPPDDGTIADPGGDPGSTDTPVDPGPVDPGVADPGIEDHGPPDPGGPDIPPDIPELDVGPICGQLAAACPAGFDCIEGACTNQDDQLWIPPGWFSMGCNDTSDSDCDDSEKPAHMVNVPAFLIDRYEVTVAQWSGCVGASGCVAVDPTECVPNDDGDLPINCVSRQDAHDYCAWTSKRLCTEAEWEKAARGGCESWPAGNCADNMPIYPWGDETATCTHANMADPVTSEAGCGTQAMVAVGFYPDGRSVYGVDDMAGNAQEWIRDHWHPTYADAPDDGSEWEGGTFPVLRGGSFQMEAKSLRASSRFFGFDDETPSNDAGIRCCDDYN